MRVIAGSARSLPLKTAAGMDTRPTTDRIRETLFNMLGSTVPDCRFLDLFAGSGAIGIEALSRGAARAVFVEKNPKAAACIRQNLEFTRLDARAVLLRTDVFAALGSMQEPAFDVIFMDPPYNCGLERRALEMLAPSHLADAHTLVIAEASLSTGFTYLDELGFEVIKYKKYKTNAHIFLKKKGSRV